MRRSAALLAVVGVFVAGIVAGVLGTHLFYARQLRQPGGLAGLGARLFANTLERRLDLTAAQRHEIDRILEQTHREAQSLRQDVQPRIAALLETTADRIDEVLTPEQREEFRRLRERHRQRAATFLLGP